MNDVTVERSALGALRVVVRWPTQESPTEVWLTPEQGAELARQLVAAIDEVPPPLTCSKCGGWTCRTCKGVL